MSRSKNKCNCMQCTNATNGTTEQSEGGDNVPKPPQFTSADGKVAQYAHMLATYPLNSNQKIQSLISTVNSDFSDVVILLVKSQTRRDSTSLKSERKLSSHVQNIGMSRAAQ